MTKLQKTFIRNLRQQRERLRMTQEQVAERSKISHKYYGAVELGYKMPSALTIEKLAQTLRVSPHVFFVDAPTIEEMPGGELLDRYNEFLAERYRSDLPRAKAEFLKGLEPKKGKVTNPFEGDEMFKE